MKYMFPVHSVHLVGAITPTLAVPKQISKCFELLFIMHNQQKDTQAEQDGAKSIRRIFYLRSCYLTISEKLYKDPNLVQRLPGCPGKARMPFPLFVFLSLSRNMKSLAMQKKKWKRKRI